MKRYILIWEVQDYPDLGGGTKYDLFETIKQVEDMVNQLTKEDTRISISFCGELNDEIKFKPVEKITLWEVAR